MGSLGFGAALIIPIFILILVLHKGIKRSLATWNQNNEDTFPLKYNPESRDCATVYGFGVLSLVGSIVTAVNWPHTLTIIWAVFSMSSGFFLIWFTYSQYVVWFDRYHHRMQASNPKCLSNLRRPDTGINVEDRWEVLPHPLINQKVCQRTRAFGHGAY